MLGDENREAGERVWGVVGPVRVVRVNTPQIFWVTRVNPPPQIFLFKGCSCVVKMFNFTLFTLVTVILAQRSRELGSKSLKVARTAILRRLVPGNQGTPHAHLRTSCAECQVTQISTRVYRAAQTASLPQGVCGRDHPCCCSPSLRSIE